MSLSTPPDKKRIRRTKAQVEQLERQILNVLTEDHPQSIRHVFYRMTDPRLPEPVSKTDKGYNQVQSRMSVMRREGRLPYGWITDATRRGHFTRTYSDPAAFIRAHAGLYRGDLWQQSPYLVEVWCESRSIAGVIKADCRDLAVSLYPCGGFTSWTLAYEAAQDINEVCARTGKEVVILYIGDYDPAGVLIDKSLECELRRHLHADVRMQFVRLAITPEQIEQHDLPTKLRKTGDRRALHVEQTVEAEAMPAHILRQILRDHVEAHLPPDALRVTKVAEQEEQRFLIRLAAELEASP